VRYNRVKQVDVSFVKVCALVTRDILRKISIKQRSQLSQLSDNRHDTDEGTLEDSSLAWYSLLGNRRKGTSTTCQ